MPPSLNLKWTGCAAAKFVREGSLGDVRRIVVHDGHQGPQEIGVNKEFLDWLTDPELNGGGALPDFGCYGANLMNQLMENARPVSVTAITQQIKPHVYPLVEDEATILVRYPTAVGIIQASWNWPFPRKDMEVYGETGQAICVDANRMRVRLANDSGERQIEAPKIATPHDEPFRFLAAVVRGKIDVRPTDLSSLENNLLVMEILEAAKTSAKIGKTVELD